MPESTGEHEAPSNTKRVSSRRRRQHLDAAAPPLPPELNDGETDADEELEFESIERYNRRFDSSRRVPAPTAETRPRPRGGAERVRLRTSASASNGWAARFSKLTGVKHSGGNED